MTSWRVHAARFRSLFARRRIEAGLDAEVRAHLALLAEEYERGGMSPRDAAAAARRAFGGVVRMREAHRDERSWLFASHLSRDFWLAIRRAIHEPRLVAVITLTVGLGVGANAAMLDAATRILFRPLPVPRASEVVSLYNIDRQTGRYLSTSYPDFLDFSRLPSLRGLALYLRMPLGWIEGEGLRTMLGEVVTPNYFTLLEVPPVVGTSFDAERQSTIWPLVAMLSEQAWREHLSSDPGAIGRSINLSGQSFTIIGVVPRSFAGYNLNWYGSPAVWIPLDAIERVAPSFREKGVLSQRAMPIGIMLGRLRPGATIDLLQSQAAALAANLAADAPATHAHIGAAVLPAGQAKFYPGYRDTVARSLGAFIAATSLVFILACCNLITIVSERNLRRQRELAVRLSLGGSRRRIGQQLLAEGVVFAAPGFVLALVAAAAVMHGINAFPAIFGTGMDLQLSVTWHTVVAVLLFSLAMVGLMALPAVRLRRTNLAMRLKQDDRTMSRAARGWVRTLPVAVQFVVSAVLLAGAFLIGRSVMAGRGSDLGFEKSHLVAVSFDWRPGYRPSNGHAAVVAAGRLVQQSGAAQSFSEASALPLRGTRLAVKVGAPADGTPTVEAGQLRVGPRFFETTGIAIRRGRALGPEDQTNAPQIGVVSESVARRLWPDADPVGKTMLLMQGKDAERVQIVGVARDVRYWTPWDEIGVVYRLEDSTSGWVPALLLKTAAPAARARAAVRRALGELPDGILLNSIWTADDALDRALEPERAAGAFVGLMAALAVLVAGIGLHHTLGYTVEQRRREIAVRIALGGAPLAVSAQVLRSSIVLTLVAAVAGTIASLAFTPVLTAQAKGVPARDLPTLLTIGLVLLTSCAAISAVSIARAVRTEPAALLRME